MNKILSVIIPMYNSAQWLEKCLNSVLNQDLPEEQMEIICVNDGSPDNSAELARKMGEKHNSIMVFDQENQGPSGARNSGIRYATGKYLCFVDPDDFVEPNVYGGLIRQMEEEQLDMLRFNYQIVDEKYHIQPQPDSESRFDYTPELMSGNKFLATRLGYSCYIWLYIYRRRLITDNEIWCFTGDYFDDTPWLPLVLQKAERVNIIIRVVSNYYQRSDSLVKSQSPSTIAKKHRGYAFMIDTLEKERRCVTDKGVDNWYRQMIATAVVSWLTMVATTNMKKRMDVLQCITRNNLLPLSTYYATPKMKRKITLINLSPRVAMWIIKLKNL